MKVLCFAAVFTAKREIVRMGLDIFRWHCSIITIKYQATLKGLIVTLKEVQPISGYAKYKQAKEEIYNQILRSNAQPGDKICTEAVLMESLNVSVTTVRRALGELVQEGILVRKVGKGTFLKATVRAASDTQNRSMLLLGYNSWRFLSEDIYYGPIVKAMGQTLREADIRQMALISDWGQSPESELEDIRRHNPAAIVYPYVSDDVKPFVLALTTLGVPVLSYNHPLEGLSASQVYFDDYQGGADAAMHLIGRGHRELAVIAPPDSSPCAVRRVAGFVETVEQNSDARMVGQVMAASYGDTDGYGCVDGILAGKRPHAIFCGSDMLAYGAIKRLEELGLSVPKDVAVMGYGDFQVSALYHPKLTTMRMDLEQMGQQIGQWVQRVVDAPENDDEVTVDVNIPVELRVRDTA